MKYNDQLYTEDYAQKFLDSVIYVLNQFIDGDNDNLRICDIALCDEIDDTEFSEVELPFVHKRFEKQVGETPDNVALIAGDATLTTMGTSRGLTALPMHLLRWVLSQKAMCW